mmetsp:Transcript_111854/g.316420  ORF Transcript_111854/g.316420 Transcript_111854/m.316420 type:complete len:202 (+) Transcript_111854:774-1379(+)
MICTSSCCACIIAPLFTFTSKPRMTEYSGLCFSLSMAAFLTSFLCTSPMPMSKTGIFISLRKDSNASSEPSVLAFTSTPSVCLSKPARMLSRLAPTCSLSSSASSPGPTTRSSVPATAPSRPGAQTLTPAAAQTWACRAQAPLARACPAGTGVWSARTVARIGPPMPATTIWSPSCRVPLTRITSIVVPRPSTFLTSITVH